MRKIIFPLTLILAGLALGYLWQQWAKKRGTDSEKTIPAIRKKLQKICLLFFMPVSFVGAIWVVSFQDVRVVFLPVIGAAALLLGGVFGLGLAALLKKDGRQRGTLFCCGSFTNIGAIGSLVAFVLYGDTGFGMISLYRMFEEVIYYTIGFPVARYYSGAAQQAAFRQRIVEVSRDPFVRAAVGAFFCGLILNQSGIPRPHFFEIVNSFFIPTGTFLLLVSIGLGIHFSSVGGYLVEGFLVSVIKFMIIPLFAGTAAYAMGFADINDGLPFKVVLIASSMPVALNALAAVSIYDLDLDLANSCWLITTSALFIILPCLVFFLNFI